MDQNCVWCLMVGSVPLDDVQQSSMVVDMKMKICIRKYQARIDTPSSERLGICSYIYFKR